MEASGLFKATNGIDHKQIYLKKLHAQLCA